MKKRFIFDENYIKRYAKKDKTRILVIGVCVLLLIMVLIIVLLISKGNKRKKPNAAIPNYELKEELTLESGNTLPEAIDYFKKLENIDVKSIEVTYPEDFEVSYDIGACSEDIQKEISSTENPNFDDYECAVRILKTPTTYGVVVKVLGEEKTVNLKVQDTQAPVVITKDLEIYEGEEYKIDDFIKNIYDATDAYAISYYTEDLDKDGNMIDYGNITEIGEHTVKLIAKDGYDNTTDVIEVKLTIKEPDATIYSVTFNSNGGSNVRTIKVEAGKKITAPASPVRDGYNFVGWYLGNNVFDFREAINSDITLEARWEEASSGNSQGGNGGSGVVNPGTVDVDSVWISMLQVSINVGESKTVTASVKPANATNRNITWSSSNNGVATVNNGVITGVSAGTATITASAGGKSASLKVIVSGGSGSSSSCNFGNDDYNSDKFTLSVNLSKNGCAVDPNKKYNDSSYLSTTDSTKVKNELKAKGYRLPDKDGYVYKYVPVYNKKGTGLVGYQLEVEVKAFSDIKLLVSKYIVRSNGTRIFISNGIGLS